MTTPAILNRSVIFAFFLILSLHQICAFHEPNNYLHLNQFRIPRAAMMLNYINDSVDPCSDFYEFACGNWQNDHPATEDTPITSPMIDLEDTINKVLQVILDEKIRTDDEEVERRIKGFYASCMDSESASQSIKQVFSEFVNKTLKMPAIQDNWNASGFNWVTQVSRLRKQFGMDIIIGLNIKPSMNDRQISRIYIGEASTLIPRDICKEGDFNSREYIELQTEIIENMANWFDLDKTEGLNFAINLLQFETNLCKGMSEEVDPNAVPHINRKYLNVLDSKFPNIKFSNFVTTSLGVPINEQINFQHEGYFHHLSKILPSTSRRTIANYIMYRALYAISFPEENDKEKRASLCVEKCIKYFPKAVGDMFNRKTFLKKKEDDGDVEQLLTNLKKAFNTGIDNQLWIEESTRRLAKMRIDEMRLMFPNYSKNVLFEKFGSVTIEPKQFWENLLKLLELEQKNEISKLYANEAGNEVEPFNITVEYSAIKKKIQLPLGLLQPPVYHLSAPYSYKYGILGYLIARELINGLDEDNFDQTSLLLYKERAACFRDQYVSYVGKDLALSPVELDKKIRDIIADNGALNISFNAYLQWLEETTDKHILYNETLSDVDYTNTQLFFISFAQNYCTSVYSKEEPIGFFSWDVANYLEKFKVNGLLWNMKEFSREFNCLPGTEMNPGDKCVIY